MDVVGNIDVNEFIEHDWEYDGKKYKFGVYNKILYLYPQTNPSPTTYTMVDIHNNRYQSADYVMKIGYGVIADLKQTNKYYDDETISSINGNDNGVTLKAFIEYYGSYIYSNDINLNYSEQLEGLFPPVEKNEVPNMTDGFEWNFFPMPPDVSRLPTNQPTFYLPNPGDHGMEIDSKNRNFFKVTFKFDEVYPPSSSNIYALPPINKAVFCKGWDTYSFGTNALIIDATWYIPYQIPK